MTIQVPTSRAPRRPRSEAAAARSWEQPGPHASRPAARCGRAPAVTYAMVPGSMPSQEPAT